jgi:uncharacterized OB-fold protein
MSALSGLATYLPAWRSKAGAIAAGRDEDAVTMAVAAGRAAMGDEPPAIDQVVLVTRELPLLEGGNAAVLLAGLGLPEDVGVVEQLGGAPATLDAIGTARPGTLVLAAEVAGTAAAGAVVLGPGDEIVPVARVQRSLPLRLRGNDGIVYEDHDPRLQRDRGVRAAVDRAELPGKPVVVAGLSGRDAAELCEGTPPRLPTLGPASPIFALAALAEDRRGGLVAAIEQASLAAIALQPSSVPVARLERPGLVLGSEQPAPGPDIKFVYAAYERAFSSKVRWEAARCPSCGTLALPPRLRCLGCGREGGHELVPLPRRGTVYTTTTIHTPVPGLTSPYSLAVVALDEVDVRALVTVADAPPGAVDIGMVGSLVLRRVSTRTGVPDYGYAFQPDVAALGSEEVA